MKLKYKRIIILITMSTMCIGLVTLSVSKPKDKTTTNVEGDREAGKQADGGEGKDGAEGEGTGNTDGTGTPGPSGDADGTGSSWGEYPEINDLVSRYFEASVKGDMKTLDTLVSDISHIDENVLNLKYEYVEGYQNIECYVEPASEQGQYRVYVYSDLKLKNIETPAPGLTSLYVCLSDDGKPKIYLGELSEEQQNFIEEADASSKVADLIKTVDAKLTEALAKDEDLSQFNKQLENPEE